MTDTSLIDVVTPADPWAGRPTLSRGVVPRPRLVAALAATGPGCVAVLAAPAGYGKTTLLCQWEAARRAAVRLGRRSTSATTTPGARSRRRARLALPADCHADERVRARPRRRRTCCAPDGRAARAAADRRRAARRRRARARLARRGRRCRSRGCARSSRLVELGAGRPRDDARARPRSCSVSAIADLAGRRARRAGRGGPEGWPAGSRWRCSRLADAPAPAHFDGADRLVADYLRDEVLAAPDRRRARVPAPRRRCSTSLTGPACDAVLERTRLRGGARAARARPTCCSSPLDRAASASATTACWREVLRARAARVEPDARERAAPRARARGCRARRRRRRRRPPRAAPATTVVHAGELVWASAAARSAHGDAGAVERWLERFTRAPDRARPRRSRSPRPATQLPPGGATSPSTGRSAPRCAATPADATPAVAGRARRPARGARPRRAWRAWSRTPRSPPALLPARRPLAALCQPRRRARRITCWATATRAAAVARGAARGAPRSRRRALHALCLAQLGVLALEREDWDEAARAGHPRARAGRPPRASRATRVRARVRRLRARPRAARARRRRARTTSPQADAPAGRARRLRALVRGRARASSASGPRCACATSRTRAPACATPERFARRVPGARPCSPRGWSEAATSSPPRRRRPARRPPSLTTAELRILRFLPTHLSFREIAERTFVSANTVKTQANAVYRKLDVSSRSEAVDPARATLGVLDPS